MLPKKHNTARIVFGLIITLFFLGLSLVVVVNKQYVLDQISVWQFKPTDQVQALADRSGMNSYGRFLYEASQPTLDGSQSFNNECDRVESTTYILGCYKDLKIYVYDVTDPQLDGVREVTAAHEMLHAAYYRLSGDDKTKVNNLLEQEYTRLELDKDYSERMAFYARTEPGQRDNELFSVIGTEIKPVSPELEAYYSRYFADRQKVVDLNTKYSSIFISLRKTADDLAAQMNTLSAGIAARTDQYNIDIKQLENDITSYNARAAAGVFTSMAQFNSERVVLVKRVTTVNGERDTINSDITKYGQMLDQYNSIATQSKKLYNSIDSSLAPAPSV